MLTKALEMEASEIVAKAKKQLAQLQEREELELRLRLQQQIQEPQNDEMEQQDEDDSRAESNSDNADFGDFCHDIFGVFSESPHKFSVVFHSRWGIYAAFWLGVSSLLWIYI